MPTSDSGIVEKAIPFEKLTVSNKPPLTFHLGANTKASTVSEMSSEPTLQLDSVNSDVTEDTNVVSAATSSSTTSSGETASPNLDTSTGGGFASETRYLTPEQREEGEITCVKDYSQIKEQRIKDLFEELGQLKIENERLKLKLNSCLSEPDKPKPHQPVLSRKKQVTVAWQSEGLSKDNVSGTCDPLPTTRIWTQAQISRLTKLLIATKQIINKYAKEHHRLEESNKKLLQSNRFLTESQSSLERQNQTLHQQIIEKDTKIDKLHSRNMLLSAREKESKTRLRSLEERLKGWAISVLSTETDRNGESEDQSCSTQVEGEKDEEMFQDSDIPGILQDTKCTGEDPTGRSSLTTENEDGKIRHCDIPKLTTNSVVSDPKIQHFSSQHNLQKSAEEKSPPVQHKFPRPIDRLPEKVCPQNDFGKFNGKFRKKRRKRKKIVTSCKRPPIGSELAASVIHQQSDLVFNIGHSSARSESTFRLCQTVLASGVENPNNRN